MIEQILKFGLLGISLTLLSSCYSYNDLMNDLYAKDVKKKKNEYTYKGHNGKERSLVISEIPELKMEPQNIVMFVDKKGNRLEEEKAIRSAVDRKKSYLKSIGVKCCYDPPICGMVGYWSVPGYEEHRVIIVNDLFKTKKIIDSRLINKENGTLFMGKVRSTDVIFPDFYGENTFYSDGIYIFSFKLKDKKTGVVMNLSFEQAFIRR